MRLFSILVLVYFAVPPAQADDSKPAATNVPRAEYPKVHTDGRVTFRLKAPDAKGVKVQPGGADNGLGKDPHAMAQSDDGTWTVTTPPTVPGFHCCWLVVDGVAVNDPVSETFFGYGRPTSGVDVPSRASTSTTPRTCRTARCGRCGTTPRSPARRGIPRE